MDDREFLLCAAIWCKELPLVKPEVLENRGFRPYNVNVGIVFSGWRHPNCVYQIVALTGKRMAEIGEYEQGFLTSKNRFVDRYEGMKLAKESKQVDKNKNGQLYSEDLY